MPHLKLLFFLHRVGPYHHARFQAVESLALTVVETRPASEEYPWQFEAVGKYKKSSWPVGDDSQGGLRGEILQRAVNATFEKFTPDVVVTTGWADPEYHAIVLAAARRKIPCIIISDSRHEDEPRKFYKEFVKRLILRSYSAALVAGTQSSAYLTGLGFPTRSIFQPWDVVDNNYFSTRVKEHAFPARSFVCVCRFVPKKNINTLISAFADYRQRGGHRKLLLLGSGDGEQALRAHVAELGLEKEVIFEGFVQYEHLPDYFSAALCLILPSTSDQWGLVVNEAMASGLPVLVSANCGCAPDLVKEGENGYCFNPYLASDIAEKMRAADAIKEHEWQIMGEASRTIIKQWSLSAFDKGLSSAAEYAVAHPSVSMIKFVHTLLSR